MKKLTLNDIAKRANVSPTTVSLVLNNKWKNFNISPSTYKKIIEISEKLNYKPNIFARGLKLGKTTFIGVIIGHITRGMENLFMGIQSYLSVNGYEIILRITDIKLEKEIEAIKYITEKKVDGVILDTCFLNNERIKNYIKEMEKIGIKMVFVGNEINGFKSPFVGNDNEKIGYIATKHLISHGHKKILCITNTHFKNLIGILRVKGYKKALKEAGIKLDKTFIFNFNPEKYGYFKGGYITIKKILKEKGKFFTAIFAHGDPTAMGIIKGIHESGLKIPEDIAIVSVDNTEFSEYTNPPLTTVHIDNYKVGYIAAEKLCKLINGEKVESEFLKPELIIRNSCGKH